jgi:hypothetical protein
MSQRLGGGKAKIAASVGAGLRDKCAVEGSDRVRLDRWLLHYAGE